MKMYLLIFLISCCSCFFVEQNQYRFTIEENDIKEFGKIEILVQNTSNIKCGLIKNEFTENVNMEHWNQMIYLRNNVGFDYEKMKFGVFQINCTDSKKRGGGSKRAWILLEVINVNDNPPYIVNRSFNVTNNQVGSVIGRLRATDADGDDVDYKLTKPSEYFKINSETGDIIYVKEFTGNKKEISVKVTDDVFESDVEISFHF